MTRIDVQTASEGDGWSFTVTVSDGGSQSNHRVRLSRAAYARLTGEACTPEELVRKSFEFLMAREGKDSILRKFDLTVISRYFPEYEREIAERVRS